MNKANKIRAQAQVVRGTRRGYRSVAVTIWPDGTLTRADIECALAKGMTRREAAKALGMTDAEFTAKSSKGETK